MTEATTHARARPTLSIVLPIYDEEAVIPELHARLQQLVAGIGVTCEILFVNDGSKDRSLALLKELAAKDARYRVLSFSRNFGHQAAITAGVDYARGEAVVVMDADLQDPPDIVVRMLEKWREGFDVVYGRRRSREGETPFKKLTAAAFYRIFAAMIPLDVPLDVGDFRLMSRRVVVALRALRESHRFVRGLVSWIGFRQTALDYDRPARFAGETKYPLLKMLRFALDGITSFSVVPLRFATYLGMLTSILSLGYGGWALVAHFVTRSTVRGWTSEVFFIALTSSAQLLVIGILGEYVGRIYEQVKLRPTYVIGELVNLGRAPDSVDLDDAPRDDGVVEIAPRPPPLA